MSPNAQFGAPLLRVDYSKCIKYEDDANISLGVFEKWDEKKNSLAFKGSCLTWKNSETVDLSKIFCILSEAFFSTGYEE